MSLLSRLSNIFRRDRLRREIEEEFASHLHEAVSRGRDPVEARRAFGPLLQQREQGRDLRLLPWLDSLRADAVFGWRQLAKRKVTSAAAILSLALAIGACTCAFRIVDALLLRPLPVAHPERLYVVAFENAGLDGKSNVYDSSSYPMFRAMRAAVAAQADLIAVSYLDRTDLTYGSDDDMEKAYVQNVSGEMFNAFGLQPALGRLFTAGDDVTPGAHPYAVLSHDYWSRRFARDPRAVGRTFRLGNTLYQIVGVAGPRFTGTETGAVTDIFIPMMMKNPVTLASSNNFWLRTLVQLQPGAAPRPVGERLRAVYQADKEERAKSFVGMPRERLERFWRERMLLEPAAAGRSELQRRYGRPLVALAVLLLLVLLIACANVANLMTARSAARAREMALRVSIGAGPSRLVQLVLMESAWLAFLSTALGAVFAWYAAPLIVAAINPPDNPARLALRADWRVFAFGLALAVCVTFLFGLAPALRASSVKPAAALKGGEDPHSRRRLMRALVAAQVAFCFVVHLVAGLFVTTLDRLAVQPLGFSAERLLNLETVTQGAQAAPYWDQVAARLRAVRGVESVALTVWPMLIGEARVLDISIDGAPPSDVFSDLLGISPGWLETMRIPLLDGRDFRESDTDPSVALVNQAFAKQYFAGANPTGKWFERVGIKGERTRTRILGFVRDARSRDDLRRPIRPTIYVPLHSADAQGALLPRSRGTFVVRTAAVNPLALAATLRREVAQARPGFRVSNVRPQAELVQNQTIRERLMATLALFFAAVALLLAGIGLYGVLDYSVLQRRREFGIRIAIGARTGDIAGRVTAEVFTMVAMGALTGLALGLASCRYLEALLYGVKATDFTILALPCCSSVGVAALAAIPAILRALRIDPVAMLRSE
jgi:predicted permease